MRSGNHQKISSGKMTYSSKISSGKIDENFGERPTHGTKTGDRQMGDDRDDDRWELTETTTDGI